MQSLERIIPKIEYTDPIKANTWPFIGIFDSYKAKICISKYSDLEDDLKVIFDKIFDKKYMPKYFYDQNNKNNILSFLSNYFDKFIENYYNYGEYIYRLELLFSYDLLIIKLYEGDYGSVGLIIFTNDYNNAERYISNQFYGNLGADDITIVTFENNFKFDLNKKYTCSLKLYNSIFEPEKYVENLQEKEYVDFWKNARFEEKQYLKKVHFKNNYGSNLDKIDI